jgi:hypothetical protein
MNHKLKKLCLFPCFTLVAIICTLVMCCHLQGKGVLLEVPHKGNVLFPCHTLTILEPVMVIHGGNGCERGALLCLDNLMLVGIT